MKVPDKDPTIKLEIDKRVLSHVDNFHRKYEFQSRTEALNWLIAWAFKRLSESDAAARARQKPEDIQAAVAHQIEAFR